MFDNKSYISIVIGVIASVTTNISSADDCSGNLFDIAAKISRIEPAGAQVSVKGNKTENKSAGSLLCYGDLVMLPKGVKKLELQINDDFEQITSASHPDGFYLPEKTIANVSKKAFDYIVHIISTDDLLPQKHKSIGTYGPRGESDDKQNQKSNFSQPLRHIEVLRDLPTQSIVKNASIILSFRNGVSPWVCQAHSQDKEVVIKSPPVSFGWCAINIGNQSPSRLSVKDSYGGKLWWNIQVVAMDYVPKPEWVNNSDDISSEDKTAWAIWLWHSGDAKWRLQAMSMLNVVARDSWLASYMLNSILADEPLVAAN